MTKKKDTVADAPVKQNNFKKIVAAILWLYAAVFFGTSAVLVFKAYSSYVTNAISVQLLAISVVIVVAHFIKSQK